MKTEIRTPKNENEWQHYYALRYEVLRKPLGQAPGSERNDGDLTGNHFALFCDQELVAIGRLDQASPGVSQARFVAVHPKMQGKGWGRKIMEAMEQFSKEQGNQKMILHARDYAVDFYKQLDYTIVEKSHVLFGVLQHYLMQKTY